MSRALALAPLVVLLAAAPAVAAEPTHVMNLWPGKPPGETATIPPESKMASRPEERCQNKITNVSTPTLAVFRPAKEKDTGAAVVIAPGGGYHIVAYDLEGEEVAAWLNSIGVTGVILKYRVPRRPGTPGDQPPVGALQDAQRALSVVRSKAGEWGLDPKRIGLLGFSAGGHLTAWTTTNSDRRAYEPVDDADKASCRPDFAVLVYPAYLQDRKAPSRLSEEIRVSADTPPFFLAHAFDDPISPENSLTMFLALKKAGVPADLHVYAAGGHGFGLRKEKPCGTWPDRCAEWMRDRGIIAAAK